MISASRLAFGCYNQDLLRSGRQRLVCRFCCVFVVVTLDILYIYAMINIVPLVNVLTTICFEPTVLGIISQFVNACPLTYFQNVLSRCKTVQSKRLVLYIFIYVAYRAFVSNVIYVTDWFSRCDDPLSPWCELVLSWRGLTAFLGLTMVEIQRLPVILSVGLLYCDMKTLLKSINDMGVHTTDFVEMYENIYRNFKKVELATKIQVLFITVQAVPYFATKISKILAIIASKEPRSVVLQQLKELLTFPVVMSHKVVLIFLLELVYDLQEEIQKCLMDRVLHCTEESARGECERVCAYVRERPLHLRTCGGAVPLGAPLLAALGSLAATYAVATLQLKKILT